MSCLLFDDAEEAFTKNKISLIDTDSFYDYLTAIFEQANNIFFLVPFEECLNYWILVFSWVGIVGLGMRVEEDLSDYPNVWALSFCVHMFPYMADQT